MAEENNIRLYKNRMDAFASIIWNGLIDGVKKANKQHTTITDNINELVQQMQFVDIDSDKYRQMKDWLSEYIISKDRTDIALGIWKEVIQIYSDAEDKYRQIYDENKEERVHYDL